MNLKQLCILIVEDDLIYATRLKHWLTSQGVQQVDHVESAEAGKKHLESTPPHIIFLDKDLPDSKGTEAIPAYKLLAPNCTIIVMSANYQIDDVALGIQEGADYLFDKKTITKAATQQILNAAITAKNKNKSIWNILSIFSTPKAQKEHLNIAIVEDDELFSYHLGWLIEQKGKKSMDISSYSNAMDFYKSYQKKQYDVVFLDYFLPDTTGEDILKYIKENRPTTKVIMLSSQESTETALKLNGLGIENYIVKDKNWTNRLKTVIETLKL